VRNWVAKHDKNKGGAHKSKKDYDRKDRSDMENEVKYLDLETQLQNLQDAIHTARELQQVTKGATAWAMYQEEIDILNEQVEKLRDDKS
jgi:predicted  nucleic acid-binding Zn-ribbon protein